MKGDMKISCNENGIQVQTALTKVSPFDKLLILDSVCDALQLDMDGVKLYATLKPFIDSGSESHRIDFSTLGELTDAIN